MADIPNQSVIGRVKNIMQSHRQFDNTKTGPQMTARHRDRINHFNAQFIGQLAQITLIQLTQISRARNAIQKRCLFLSHSGSFAAVLLSAMARNHKFGSLSQPIGGLAKHRQMGNCLFDQ